MPIHGFRPDVYRDGRPAYVNDFMEREEFVRFIPQGHMSLDTVMFAPLNIAGKPVGLMGLSNKDEGFTERDLFLSEIFADLAAVALRNSRNLEMLEESERTLQELATGAFDCIVLIDPADNIVFINEAGKKILGVDDPLGFSLPSLLDVDDGTLPAGMSTMRIDRPEGVIYLEMSVSASSDRRRVVVIRDVTEAVVRNQELELAKRKLEIMGKATRHDVMNHLLVLEGYANLFFDENVPMLPEHGEAIMRSLSNMRGLFEMQRSFEMIGTTEPEWGSLGDTVRNSTRNLDIKDQDIMIDVDDCEILADELLEKAFYNLLQNALTHAEDFHTLRVSTSEDDGHLLIVFEDDGLGIPAEEKEEIFKMGHGRNSGQGLFLVREVLTTNGMSVTEEGVPGQGARFVIRVPPQSWRIG